jgi:hypothetical protein
MMQRMSDEARHNRKVIDALRELLGIGPLYGREKPVDLRPVFCAPMEAYRQQQEQSPATGKDRSRL